MTLTESRMFRARLAREERAEMALWNTHSDLMESLFHGKDNDGCLLAAPSKADVQAAKELLVEIGW